MFICLRCGHIFDENSIATWEENVGEYWGAPCYVTSSGCPYCGGSYAETYKCNCCEEWIEGSYIKTDNDQRICENCYRVMEPGDEDY